jgi:NodT family efflux transporter outer membrane factor (OMF) lipoprotein
VLAALGGALTACPVGPNYRRPTFTAQAPTAFKESADWKQAKPKDALPHGSWWHVFGDDELDGLMNQVNVSNQTLKAAEAQWREAQAQVTIARAPLFPTVTTGTNVSVAHGVSSAAAASGTAIPTGGVGGAVTGGGTSMTFSVPASLSWEADVWGRVRRAVEAAQATAAATQEDLEAARLSAQATLAGDYFQLETLDAEKKLFDETVTDLEKTLEVTRNRYAAGVAQKTDVLQAQAQLESVRAQAIDVQAARAQMEHAIAVLIGRPPEQFSLSPRPLKGTIPDVPLAVPSELLERRPDVAAAERRMEAANAQVGVATAAWFPHLTLSASLGLLSSTFTRLFSLPSLFWAVGPGISETVFQGFQRVGQMDQAHAAWDAAVATYRQTALGAFQDVEDNLAALRVLEKEAKAADSAAADARQVVTLTRNQYEVGTAQYLDVLVAQTNALNDERTALNVTGRRMAASVLLIKALGGVWTGEAPRR